MTIKKYIFCQCMKPWSICKGKNNSHKIDVRGLINIYNLSPYLNELHLNFDFINMRPLQEKFACRVLKNEYKKNDFKNIDCKKNDRNS
jgi:hypothetical protein